MFMVESELSKKPTEAGGELNLLQVPIVCQVAGTQVLRYAEE
jgi:hypothetical protein